MLNLDLRNLTPQLLAEAEPRCGRMCRYSAPCIIGTLVPSYERRSLDDADCSHSLDDTTIETLVHADLVSFPNQRQEEDAQLMQRAFDGGDWDQVLEIAKQYMK